jgi:hypothetical protein
MCVCVCGCVIHIHINVPPTTLIVKDETSYMSVVLCWCTISPRGIICPVANASTMTWLLLLKIRASE